MPSESHLHTNFELSRSAHFKTLRYTYEGLEERVSALVHWNLLNKINITASIGSCRQTWHSCRQPHAHFNIIYKASFTLDGPHPHPKLQVPHICIE